MSILIGAVVVGLGLGFLLVPGMVRVLGPSLPGKSLFGTGNFILGQLANNGSLAYRRADGNVELVPYDSEDKTVWIDGDWKELDDDPTVYRLGWRPFLISWEKTEQSIGNYLVENPDVTHDAGESALLKERSGGIPLYTSWPVGSENGYVVHAVRYVKEMGRTGNRLINRAEEIAMRDYGGQSRLNDMKFVMILGAEFFLILVTTYVMLGVF